MASAVGSAIAGRLNMGAGNQSKVNVTASCMQFAENETDRFYVGAEDFQLYQCNLHADDGKHVQSVM